YSQRVSPIRIEFCTVFARCSNQGVAIIPFPPSARTPRMNPLHTVLLTVGLFALSFLSPGPNLLVVVQASLQGGRVAGLMTGLGVAAGDACYAALGRFGMAPLITAGGSLFAWVQMAGGAYLVWYAFQLVRRRQP